MTVESLNDRSSAAWDFLEPVRRFPLPVLCALALTALNWSRFDSFQGTPYRGALNPMHAAAHHLSPFLIAAFFLSFALALYGEAKGRKVAGLLAAVAGVLLLAVLYSAWTGIQMLGWLSASNATGAEDEASLLSRNLLSLTAASRWFLLGGLALLPVLGPYAGWRAEPGAFWQFAHKLGVAFLAAAAGAGLAFGGFAAIIETAKLLFGLTFPPLLYSKATSIAICFCIPIIWLTLTPDNFGELPKTGAEKEFTSRAVALLVKYILIPVASALSLMLAAYIVLVLIEGRFETAKLGYRSLVYGCGIIITALLSYPEREDSWIVRAFWRIWPWLLVAPSVLFFAAFWVRTGEYGWTAPRYLACLGGIWMALTAILAVRFRSDLRFIPGLVSLLLILAAFGPWGVSQVTGRSQSARLEAFLTERGVLSSGKWREGNPAPTWTWKERQQVQAALLELSNTGQLGRLKPWFQGAADDPFVVPANSLTNLQVRLGVNFAVADRRSPETVNFVTSSPMILKIASAAHLAGPIHLWDVPPPNRQKTVTTPLGSLDLKASGTMLEIRLNSDKLAKFDLKDFLAGVRQTLKDQGASGTVLKENTPRLISGEGDPAIKLAIAALNGSLESGEIYSWTVYVLLPAEP
jgi:hypothetical protein